MLVTSYVFEADATKRTRVNSVFTTPKWLGEEKPDAGGGKRQVAGGGAHDSCWCN